MAFTPASTSAAPPGLPFCWVRRWGAACSMTGPRATTSRSLLALRNSTAPLKHSPTAPLAYSIMARHLAEPALHKQIAVKAVCCHKPGPGLDKLLAQDQNSKPD